MWDIAHPNKPPFEVFLFNDMLTITEAGRNFLLQAVARKAKKGHKQQQLKWVDSIMLEDLEIDDIDDKALCAFRVNRVVSGKRGKQSRELVVTLGAELKNVKKEWLLMIEKAMDKRERQILQKEQILRKELSPEESKKQMTIAHLKSRAISKKPSLKQAREAPGAMEFGRRGTVRRTKGGDLRPTAAMGQPTNRTASGRRMSM